MWTGRGSFSFNCLKSLANSLSLECSMTSSLTLLHSLACTEPLCAIRRPNSSWEDSPSRRQSVETDPIITGAMSASQSFRFPHHIFVWLAYLTFISVSHTLVCVIEVFHLLLCCYDWIISNSIMRLLLPSVSILSKSSCFMSKHYL